MPATSEPRFSALTGIVRRRLLPVPGEVLVRVGDRVRPSDVVAQAEIEGELLALDVARALGIGVGRASRCISVTEGQAIWPSTVLAHTRRFGIRRREVTAPFAGVVQVVDEGHVLLRRNPRMFSLRAYVPGEVIEECPHRGVTVRAVGSLVRGIWGSGDEREGVLATMVPGPRDVLTWERVGLRYRGAILVGGILDDPRVLYRARQFRLSGLILGGMAPGLRPLCETLPLTVVVTEGMGRLSMAEPIFELLRSHHGRPAVLSGANGVTGPEVIVPLKADVPSGVFAVTGPQVGMRVRLTRPPYLGIIGRILRLPDEPQETSIGTKVEGAEARLPDGHRIFVALENMELLD